MNELWQPIPGWEAFYAASSWGRIKTFGRWIKGGKNSRRWSPPKVLSLGKTRTGYLKLALRDGKRKRETGVHIFVLEAFVGPCPPGMEACHGNGDRADNRLDNLRWDTRLRNHADRRKHGTIPTGEKHPQSKLTEDQVISIKGELKTGATLKSLGAKYGVSWGLISHIKQGRAWKHVS
jgi:hypothetical protein